MRENKARVACVRSGRLDRDPDIGPVQSQPMYRNGVMIKVGAYDEEILRNSRRHLYPHVDTCTVQHTQRVTWAIRQL